MARSSVGRARPAQRVERARRAFELTLEGHSTRRVSEMMQAEGYKQIGHVTVSRLVREYGESLVLPLAKEHVTREFERIMEQRVRLDAQRERAWEICERFHMVTNNGGVVYVEVDDGTGVRLPGEESPKRPVRDSGPELQALTVMQGIEKLVLANAEALAKLFGYRAPEEKKLTVTTDLDNAIADLVGEMNERPADVRT